MPDEPLKTLRTYQGDVEETINKKKESIVSIASAEAARKKPEPLPEPASSNGSTFLTYGILPLAGIVLLVVGFITLAGVYYYFHERSLPVPVVTQQALVPYTSEQNLTLASSSVADSIANIRQNIRQNTGSILWIQPSTQGHTLSENEFFQSLAPDAPPTLIRSFNGTYMLGIYAWTENEPFVILSTESYGETYSGMLGWEKNMPTDLATLFPSLKTFIQSTSSIAWSDDTFENRDVRIVRNQDSDIVLVYGFLDDKTVLITSDENIFGEIADKYLANKLVH